METEAGDDYIRHFASFIRTHEQRLADAGFIPRPARAPATAPTTSIFSWLIPGTGPAEPPHPSKPTVLSIDPHHLFYLLMRMEALGLPVGSLDVKLETPLKPASYLSLLAARDKADAMSISSFASTLSAVSKLSLGPSLGWLMGPPPPPPSLESELKYVFSAFTKLPALSVHRTGLKIVAELKDDLPNDTALPLDVFKNLQSLEMSDVDPRDFSGWDQLSIGLRIFTIRRSGIEDVSDVLLDAVADDQARRRGDLRAPLRNRRRILHRPAASLRTVPSSIAEEDLQALDSSNDGSTIPSIPSYSWSSLRYLALPDNALTFFPSTPLSHLASVQSLDLSSNLLVSIPPALASLSSLSLLNISNNMLDSILNISSLIPSIRTLNIAQNRLDSLCGLERLEQLERVDLRGNRVEESAEVGRLAQCPAIKEVWIEDNPFTRTESEWRVKCFEYFFKEGRDVLLDDAGPSFSERMYITSPSPVPRPQAPRVSQIPAVQPPPTIVTTSDTPSPKITAKPSMTPPTPASASPSPSILSTPNASPRPKRRKHMAKRIVDLEGSSREPSTHTSESPALLHPTTQHRKSHSEHTPGQTLVAPTATRLVPGASGSVAQAHLRAVSASSPTPPPNPEADALRTRIEALREEVGDSWLRVLSQSSDLGAGASKSANSGKIGT